MADSGMDEIVMKRPINVPTRATADFIASYLPVGAEVLEIGCGVGHVALELLNHGYHVTGVDSDPDAVAQARGRGVPAVQASWPEFEGMSVDAVAFTRSLHHISPLRQAVDKARNVLQPTGTLLVEDFAFDEVDRVTMNWFLDVLISQAGRAFVEAVPDELVTDLQRERDPVAVWHESHDHDLHTMAAMTQAVAAHFVVSQTQPVPYLYRYLVPVLMETPEAEEFLKEVFHEEVRLGMREEIALIGRRIVGLPREAVT